MSKNRSSMVAAVLIIIIALAALAAAIFVFHFNFGSVNPISPNLPIPVVFTARN